MECNDEDGSGTESIDHDSDSSNRCCCKICFSYYCLDESHAKSDSSYDSIFDYISDIDWETEEELGSEGDS